MKKTLLSMLLLILLTLMLTGCGNAADNNSGSALGQEMDAHTIAVLVYDRSDDEVQSFRNYLENYIGSIFNVKFYYSDSISSGEEALEFIEESAEYGAEGVMSFNSYDLKKEVELCAEKGMYLMMASGTVSREAFDSVADNEYFLGTIGPGESIEVSAGTDMAKHFIEKVAGDEYFIFSGGGCLGNEMHKLRTMGIIETLESAYGVSLEKSPEEIALSDAFLRLESGKLKVCVFPGYFADDNALEEAKTAYRENPYNKVMGVLPLVRLQDVLKDAKVGVVDCYSENNLRLFGDGTVDFVTGKYSSIIGPSFAAMYNAITGHAGDFRDNGKAFQLTQGFWSSDNAEDYEAKYAMASSIEMNAYNYEDLQKVIRVFEPDASLQDLKALAEACSYDDAVSRRAQ